MNADRQHITNEQAIFSLWLNWAMAVGALAIPEFLGAIVPMVWIPIIVFGIMLLLYLYRITGGVYNASSCDIIQVISMRALGVSAVIMLTIAVIYEHGYISLFFSPTLINTDIPFLSILILGPVVAFYSLLYLFLGRSSSVCRNCIIKYGPASERGFIGKLALQESRFQLRMLFYLSAGVSVVCWLYYAFFYINVNLNKFDSFVFNWVPAIFYGLSIIYLGMRYFSLWGYYYSYIELDPRQHTASSTLRFIIVSHDKVYLSHNGEYSDVPDGNRFDTPAKVVLPHTESMDLEAASIAFFEMNGIMSDDFSMRFMYRSTDVSGINNIFHYICCLHDEKTIESSPYKGNWYSLSQLQRLLYNHDLSPFMAAEIHRLYTVTMAWKTYDSEGRRLYRIKNYRPNFRIDGVCDWDVDFNSTKWLEVADFNEDKAFFRLRRFFRRRNDDRPRIAGEEDK